MQSRNQDQGRYAGHSFGFHLRARKPLQPLAVSHRNAYSPIPGGTDERPRSKKSWRKQMRDSLSSRTERMFRTIEKSDCSVAASLAAYAGIDITEPAIQLTAADVEMLVDMLDRPPRPPNAALTRAVARYNALNNAALLSILEKGTQEIAAGNVTDQQAFLAQLDADDEVSPETGA